MIVNTADEGTDMDGPVRAPSDYIPPGGLFETRAVAPLLWGGCQITRTNAY